MIHSFFQKTTLFLLSLLTAGMLSAREFKPISLAEVEIRSFSGLANSISNFVSQVKPEAAGQLIFLTAAIAMNPQTAAIDLNRPIRAVLLTGAGQSVTDPAGQYRPDMFFCLSATLRGGARIDDTISTLAGPLTVRRRSGNSILLHTSHPLFEQELNTIEKTYFPASAGRGLPDFKLNLNFQSFSRIPGVTSAMKNAAMTAPAWDPAWDDPLSRSVDALTEQLRTLRFELNFTDASTIRFSGSLVPEPGTELASYLRKPSAATFDAPATFQAADSYTLFNLPSDTQLKRLLLKQLERRNIPLYVQECVMRSNGKALLSEQRSTGLLKFSMELENGAMKPILAAMKNEKTIQQLPSGLWMLDCGENNRTIYAELRENKFFLAAGNLTEQTARRLLDDPTPLPPQVEPGTSALSHYRKGKDGTVIRKGELRLTARELLFSFQLSASDFPQKPVQIPGN